MLIGENCISRENNTKYVLKTGPEINKILKTKLYDLCKENYINLVNPDALNVDFEMTIRIKSYNEPFYFHARKLLIM